MCTQYNQPDIPLELISDTSTSHTPKNPEKKSRTGKTTRIMRRRRKQVVKLQVNHRKKSYSGEGNGSEASHIANTLSTKLNQLSRLCKDLSLRDHNGGGVGDQQHHTCNPLFRLARTLEGKLVQAQRWLADPRGPLRHVGLEACRSLAQGARSIIMSSDSNDVSANNNKINANSSPSEDKGTNDVCLESCEHVERVSDKLFAISSQPLSLKLEQNSLPYDPIPLIDYPNVMSIPVGWKFYISTIER
ncbi:unnamed protein product [Schistosoma curassoni]|uniref:WW domain-containing protein n=1 Tax=Schistosoma curassoni TaxID=6186 RepID=A0A183KP96_9TREM|nr:unnamed protein product [Schistosoma curassoni]